MFCWLCAVNATGVGGLPIGGAEQAELLMLAAQEARSAWHSARNPTFTSKHVSVMAKDGVVHLSDYVWTADAPVRAIQLAAKVPGVRHVGDELILQRAGEHGPQ